MMGHRSTILMCFCILVQQMMVEGSVLERKRFERSASKKELKDWKNKLILKFEEDLQRLQEQLRQHGPEYRLLKKFVGNPGCESPKDTIVKVLDKDLLLTSLAVASMKVAEGCPEDALKTMLKMVNVLIESPVEPIAVTNTSACSSEADEALRIILSEVPVLRRIYTLLAAGLYSSAGCDQLSTDLLPSVVRFSYSISNKEQKFDNYEELGSPDIIRQVCAGQLHELQQSIEEEGVEGEDEVKDGEVQEEEEEAVGNRRRKRELESPECEKSWERSIYEAVAFVPVANTLWELGSAIGYAIAGCSEVAEERGKKGASSLVATLTSFFLSDD